MRYRTLFLSDLHLGTRACKAAFLQRFLDEVHADHVYLVGDIVDLARLRRSWYWPPAHRAILRRLLDLSCRGSVVYLPGNHDDHIRDWEHARFGQLRFARDHVHVLADGRRLLITHGDIFDWALHTERVYGLLGRALYSLLVVANHGIALGRRLLGLPYWSFADAVKSRVAKVNAAVGRFRGCLVEMARTRGCDAILAGHVHMATIEAQEGILYCNTGDWVDSCTAVVEDWDGSLKLLRWTELAPSLAGARSSRPAPARPQAARAPAFA